MQVQSRYWNEAREAQLTVLWDEGYSASQCASRLGNITRNAIIGKVHRLGLAARRTNVCNYKPRKRILTPQVVAPRPRSNQKQLLTAFLIDKPRDLKPESRPQSSDLPRVAFADLEPHHCRYIVGDAILGATACCGLDKLPGVSYCEEHFIRCCQQSAQPQRQSRVTRYLDTPQRKQGVTVSETADV